MKKVSIYSFLTLVILVFASANIFAGKSSCGVSKKTKASFVSAKGKVCSLAHPEACKAEAQKTDKTADKVCQNNCAVKTISIQGMTCPACETAISDALKDVSGVIEVKNISYKDNQAVVYIDTTKCKDEKQLIEAITAKGYKAEIISAVSKSGASASYSVMKTGTKAICPAMKKSSAKDPKDTK